MEKSFDNALVKFRRSLTEKQRRDFQNCTLDDVHTAIDDIQARLGAQRKLKSMARIQKFIEAMTQLGQVVEIFLNVNEAVAFVWAPIKFALLAASVWAETLELLLDTYAEIGEALPGLSQFRQLRGENTYLQKHLENYYCDVLDFHRKALDVFSRPAWRTVFHSSWKTFKTQFGPTLKNLKTHRELISDEKLTITMIETQQLRDSVESKLEKLSKQMAELRLEDDEKARLELQKRRSQQLDFVSGRLGASDCQGDLDDARRERRHFTTSGRWIAETPTIKEWADMETKGNRILYMHGSPGAGKSILSSWLVDHMKEQRTQAIAEGRSVSVVHFHFKQALESRRSVVDLLRSLLIQLVEQDDTILAQLYENCLSMEKHKIQSWEQTDKLASDALKSQGLCFVIIDGLDECISDYEEEPGMEQIQVIEWFEEVMVQSDSDDDKTDTNIRLFISGQRNGILDEKLSGYPSIQLESTPEHARDIESYARKRVKDISKRFKLPSQEEGDLVCRTTAGAKGMFLYAKIVLSNLLSQVSKDRFKRELTADNFPKGLDQAYERVVVRILENPIDSEAAAAATILGQIIGADRPLKWKEIQSRFCIDIQTQTADPDRILVVSCKHLCGSLVDVHRDKEDKFGPDDVVDVVHHTATMYLLQTRRFYLATENAKMALFCARYLLSSPFQPGLSQQTIRHQVITGYYGFQDYAASSWWKHGKKLLDSKPVVGTNELDAELYDRAISALQQAAMEYSTAEASVLDSNETAHQSLIQQFKILSDDSPNWPGSTTVERRTRIIRRVIEEILIGTDRTKACPETCMLLYGELRYKCHKPWCQEFSSGFRRQDRRNRHILEHDRPLRCLVDGCFMNSIGFSMDLELRRHTERVHSTQTSVQPKFSTSQKASKSPQHMLYSAAAKGDLPAVKYCISTEVAATEESKVDDMKGKALYLAAKNGRFDICQYLLENGANPNFNSVRGGPDYNIPLVGAATANDPDITQLLLLQPNINPSLQDRTAATAAARATKNSSFKSLSIFIAKGLVAQPGQHGGSTCLRAALDYGCRQVAKKLILEGNLDFGLEADDHTFKAASTKGWADIVELLIATGHFACHFASSLRAAESGGHSEVAKLLISAITALNNEPGHEMPPLHRAIFSNQLEDFDRLIRLDNNGVNTIFHRIPKEMRILGSTISPGAPLATPFGIVLHTLSSYVDSQNFFIRRRIFGGLLSHAELDLQNLCLQSCGTAMQQLQMHLLAAEQADYFRSMLQRGFRMPWSSIEMSSAGKFMLFYRNLKAEQVDVVILRSFVKAAVEPPCSQLLPLIQQNIELAEVILRIGSKSSWKFDFEKEEEILMAVYIAGRPTLLSNLLRAGFDGNKALRGAAFAGLIELVEAIMRTGYVDPNTRDDDGKTAMEYAREQGHSSVVSLLEAFVAIAAIHT